MAGFRTSLKNGCARHSSTEIRLFGLNTNIRLSKFKASAEQDTNKCKKQHKQMDLGRTSFPLQDEKVYHTRY